MSPDHHEEQIRSGYKFQQAGRNAEAEHHYRTVLLADGTHKGALTLLASLCMSDGRRAEAVEVMRRAAAAHPDDPAVLYNYGMALLSTGSPEAAITAFEGAVRLNADYAACQIVLARVLLKLKRHIQAIAAFRQATRLDPTDSLLHFEYGIAAYGGNALDESLRAFKSAAALGPTFAAAHLNLGAVLLETGDAQHAAESLGRAIGLGHKTADAYHKLGTAQLKLHQLVEAEESFRSALQLDPVMTNAAISLGDTLTAGGRAEEAIATYHRAMALNPHDGNAPSHLGYCLMQFERLKEAIDAFRRAIDLSPDLAEAHDGLGGAFNACGQPDAAVACYQQSLKLRPANPSAASNLGSALKQQGDIEGAINAYRLAAELAPNHSVIGSNLVYALSYSPDHDGAQLCAEARRWADRHAEPFRCAHRPHANDRGADRRLRVGFVSSDFRLHAMGRALLPLFENRNRDRLEFFAYTGTRVPDSYTVAFQKSADQWRDIGALSDEQAAEQVRRDSIDILIDMAMHTEGNRLLVFARKPAPVQISYLAYPGTTGLGSIDYRITNEQLDPIGQTEEDSTEQLLRLPGTWWCYRPPPAAAQLPVQRAPFELSSCVIFACLNNFGKVTNDAIDTWSLILRAVEHSRIVIHADSPLGRTRLVEQFERNGVAASRIQFARFSTLPAYFERYNTIDICLDTFPYCGGTTSCDAMWMGVPVITLAGNGAPSRQGLTLLSNAGLAELITSRKDDYISKAVELASDLPRLCELRLGLRDRLRKSPLMDERGFAEAFDAALRGVWRNYCGQ